MKMKSLHVEDFNHDRLASGYDKDVSDETHPIRDGYDRVLNWVIERAEIDNHSSILELGSGTGNLTQKISSCKHIVCVDVSSEMEAIASEKTSHLNREFRKNDILEVFGAGLGTFDAVISTYAVHHLTETEKYQLFRLLWESLNPGGMAVFGDLMVENETQLKRKILHYQTCGMNEVIHALETEFFWRIDGCLEQLQQIGFQAEVVQFSDLSFGIAAKK